MRKLVSTYQKRLTAFQAPSAASDAPGTGAAASSRQLAEGSDRSCPHQRPPRWPSSTVAAGQRAQPGEQAVCFDPVGPGAVHLPVTPGIAGYFRTVRAGRRRPRDNRTWVQGFGSVVMSAPGCRVCAPRLGARRAAVTATVTAGAKTKLGSVVGNLTPELATSTGGSSSPLEGSVITGCTGHRHRRPHPAADLERGDGPADPGHEPHPQHHRHRNGHP